MEGAQLKVGYGTPSFPPERARCMQTFPLDDVCLFLIFANSRNVTNSETVKHCVNEMKDHSFVLFQARQSFLRVNISRPIVLCNRIGKKTENETF
jgi:hypothetical protein